jgi:hypothetical protein
LQLQKKFVKIIEKEKPWGKQQLPKNRWNNFQTLVSNQTFLFFPKEKKSLDGES